MSNMKVYHIDAIGTIVRTGGYIGFPEKFISHADHEAAIAEKDAEIDRLREALKVCAFYTDSTSRNAEKDVRIAELIQWHEKKDNRIDALESANLGLVEALTDARDVIFGQANYHALEKHQGGIAVLLHDKSNQLTKALAKLAKGEK